MIRGMLTSSGHSTGLMFGCLTGLKSILIKMVSLVNIPKIWRFVSMAAKRGEQQ